MLAFVKYLPLLLRLVELLPKIREALRANGSVMDLLRTVGPDLIPLFKEVGAQFFPEVRDALQPEAAALQLDPEAVRAIQTGMNRLGATLTVDGLYGAATKAAVAKFQSTHGIEVVDGWAGPKTKAAILTELAKLTP